MLDVDRLLSKCVRTKDDLRDYQSGKLIPFLLENPRSAAFVDMGLGKAQPKTARVLTEDGWEKIGNLQVGDRVIGSNGKPTKIVGVFPQGKRKIFRVIFNDGAETRCCDDHLWLVNTPNRRRKGLPGCVLSLSEIRASLVDRQGNRRHFIPVVDEAQFPSRNLPIDPYLLGALIGDGGLTQNAVMFSTVDAELLVQIAMAVPEPVQVIPAGGCSYRLSVGNGGGARKRKNPLSVALKELGLSGCGSDDKFIPVDYLFASAAQRIALLQGLMDTDGYCSKDGTIQFSSNSERLVDECRDLVCSLGGVARKNVKISASGKFHFTITCAIPYWIKPFRLSRKLARYTPRRKYQPARAFAEVIPDGEEEAVCIEVAARDHLYVTDDYIVTHNTVSVLTLIDELFWRGEINKALIIAPLRVAVQTWPTEMEDWRHVAWMTEAFSLIRPDPADPEVTSARRRARASNPFSPNNAAAKAQTRVFELQKRRAAQSERPIHIINREQVTWLVNFLGRSWAYDAVVIDESTSFADHSSQRFKALCKVIFRSKRVHLLTGTPAPEGIGDLFAQCYLLDGGKRFGKGITAFRQFYMMQNPYTMKWSPQLGAVEKVTAKMADICLVMREDDYLDVQKPLLIERPIVLEPSELQQYKEFERTLILELPDDVEIEAVNAGVLAQKLLQYASGAVYDAERKVHVLHDYKLDELRELVEENPGEPLMVAYGFKSSLDRLRKAFPKATVMDRTGACVADWNKGKIPMLFVHPQSAGHGLNMQLGPGRILVFFDTPSSLEQYLQVIKRIARSGQKRLVKVIHLTTRGTLDALAVPRLKNKESAQDTVTNYLRKLRKRIKG